MKKFLLTLILAFAMALAPNAEANIIGDLMAVDIDASGATIKVLGNRNIKIGNGTPTVTQNGEDLFVEGTFEVDGAARFDGAVTFASSVASPSYLDLTEMAAPASPAANVGRLYVADVAGTTSVFFKDNAGVATNLLTVGGGTLDQAYDLGGAGVGRTINATDGAVNITSTDNDAAFMLTVTPTPAGGAALGGIQITSGANSTQDSLQIVNNGSGDDIQAGGGAFTVSKTGALNALSGVFSGSLTAGTLYQSTIAAAAAGNVALTIDAAGNGTITLGETSTGLINLNRAVTMDENVTLGDATADTITVNGTIISNLALDDGVTDSPSITFQDATNETAVFTKSDGADFLLTTAANRGLQVVTGNLRVGNGVPGTAAMDGEDFYVNGDSEFDGGVQFDGVAVFGNANVTLRTNEAISFNHAANGGADDLTFALTGAFDSSIILNSAGTGTDAISLQASAGGIDVDAAAAQDVNIAGGQVALVSKDDAASAISLTADIGTSETIVVTNTQGTGESAITLLSTAGGVNVDAAAAKDLDLAGGQVKLVSKDDAAGAISLTANIGTSETITVTNTQGTGEAAITLLSTAGGIDMDAAAAKNIDIAGGQVLISSKDNAASAIALTANTGANETIVVTNTQGNTAAAITLTATAGGITLNASSGITTGDAITGDGTAALNGFLRTVTDDADGRNITAAESGSVITNAAAGAATALNLPAAAVGLTYTFVVMAAQELRVTPAAGDSVNIAGSQGDAAEYWTANAVGESLTLVAVDANNWVATSYTGTWAQQTP